MVGIGLFISPGSLAKTCPVQNSDVLSNIIPLGYTLSRLIWSSREGSFYFFFYSWITSVIVVNIYVWALFQGQAPYKGNSEPRGSGGFADTAWTPDAELCGMQWLGYLFRSSLQISNYFEVIGNYDDTQWENMKYLGFFTYFGVFLVVWGFFVYFGLLVVFFFY